MNYTCKGGHTYEVPTGGRCFCYTCFRSLDDDNPVPERIQKMPSRSALHFAMDFQRDADALAALYGAPVWLVGGAARGDLEPRDWDVRVVLSETDFKCITGTAWPGGPSSWCSSDEWEWKLRADSLKQSRIHASSYRIDFQLQEPDRLDRYKTQPRFRLDAAPDWVLSAGLPKST